jgi:hypothetical protein
MNLVRARSRSALFVAAASVVCLLAALPSHARASSSSFCPAGGGSITLGPNGACVSARFSTLRAVLFVTTNGSGVSHCAVGKANADGSGGNTIPSQCGTAALQLTPCYPAQISYAKGVSQSSTSHLFYGIAYWSGCS